MPTPPADSAQPQKLRKDAIPLLPSGPPKPIRISAYELLPMRELVRLSSRYHFLLTPPNNTPIEVTKAISLVCPEARLGSNTPSIATETGHLVAHVSRLIHGKWYCRRTPISSVPLMWPANTTLSLPVSQPLPLLALPRKLIVHVGPEVGPGAPPEFIGSGLTYFSYSKMDTLEVHLHQFMRQAPVQDRTRYGEQLGETLQERHRTYQDRIHCINLKPKPQQKQQHQQQLARPVQKKRFLPPKPSQGLLEQLPQSMQMSVQSQWLWQTTSTGSDDSHDD
ncbi:hypothetical protein Sste5344_004647 [Sporothrix stenoceras]